MITKVVHANGTQVSSHSSGKITNRAEFYCLATDPRPTDGVQNADILIEMDTGKVFIFDADNKLWREL